MFLIQKIKKYFTKVPVEQRLEIKLDGSPVPRFQLCMETKKGHSRLARGDNFFFIIILLALFVFDKHLCSLNIPWVMTGFIDLGKLSV